MDIMSDFEAIMGDIGREGIKNLNDKSWWCYLWIASKMTYSVMKCKLRVRKYYYLYLKNKNVHISSVVASHLNYRWF